MSRIVLKVTNNKDHGEGSLRWAVGETQRHNVYGRRAEFDIIFDSEEPANNQLSTGYFTIGLKSPIRISRNNLRINHIDPRQVIIGPANALGGVNAKSQTLSSDSKRHSGSLFLIGSTNQGASAYRANGFAKEDRPIVSFNYFNFIRNIARGSDGQRGGGGGGLGTGGGISIFDGDLQVSNSVFQNLIAEGGAGGKGAKGGFGGNYPNKPKAGESGGRGGIPSWLPPTSVAHPRLAGRVAEGGKGGNPGETYNPPRGCNYKGPRNISPYRGYWGSAGKTPTRSDETIGFGSGGGGGAGGGGWYVRKKQDWFSCKTTPAHPETQDRGGRGGSPGLYGSRGGRGGKGGHRKNPGSEGSSGQQGAAVGAGIAIWSAPLGPTWSKDRPSKIDLLNVTFMGNRLEGDNRNISGTKYLPENAIDIFAAPRSTQYNTNVLNPQPQIHLENVNSGTSRQDTIPLKFEDLSNFDKLTDSQNPFFTESDNAPAFFGLSQPRVVDVSNMPNLRLKGTKNVSDMFDIGFETRANKIGITQDLTDPNNPLNRIWSELVPDKEDEIYAEHQAKIEEYQSQANQSYWEAIFTTDRLEDFAWSLAQNALGKGLEKAGGGSPAAGIVGGAVAGASISIARDSIAYFNNEKEISSNISRANEQLEADLIENRQKQDDLQNYLEEASQATLASFDPSLGRSVVVIKDFELGSDNLTFPAHPPLDGEIVQIDVNGGSQSSFVLSYQLEDNSSTPFARIYLDKDTKSYARQAGCDADCILELLTLSDDEKTWNLGTKVSNTLALSIKEFTSGPGGINIVVDREQNKLPPNEKIEIQTQIGRDYIIGTQGFEAINTGGNDDIILPGGSTIEHPDQINGAGGSDLVSYVSQQKPIEISSSDNKRVLNVSRKDSGTVIGELSNIENFHAFGPSSFDLSKLSPDDEYGIVSGSGSKIKGSEGDEQYQISLYDDYNIDLKTALSKKTVIDGNGGTNILFFNTPKTENFEINSPSAKAFKVSYKGEIILKATDIDEFFFNDTNDWVSTMTTASMNQML